MNNLVLLRTFTQHHQLEIVQTCLESHGIATFVQDVFTDQLHQADLNSNGELNLFVVSSDYENALLLLKELGVTPNEHHPNKGVLFQIVDLSKRVQILKNIPPRYVILIPLLLIISLLGYGLYTIITPDKYFTIVQEHLCTNEVTFQGNYYIPNTVRQFIIYSEFFCDEALYLQDDEHIRLPGFNSREVIGRWTFSSDSLHISDCDTFGFVYNGVYGIEINHSTIVFSSETTRIICTNPKNCPL